MKIAKGAQFWMVLESVLKGTHVPAHLIPHVPCLKPAYYEISELTKLSCCTSIQSQDS